MNELEAQSLFVRDANNQGGFARKISHRFVLGIADIYVKMPGADAAWIECKLERMPVRRVALPLELTPHQRRFLKDNRAAGGVSLWLLMVQTPKGMLGLCGDDLDMTEIMVSDYNHLATLRGRGNSGPWPIEHLMRNIF